MFSSQDQDDGVAWPSYVDFMSTFIFVLIIFVGGLLYLLSGDIGDRTFHDTVSRPQEQLKEQGIFNWIEGRKLYISLKDKVVFETGCPDPNKRECRYNVELSDENKRSLRTVADIIAKNPGAKRIVIEGRADTQKYHDKEGNPDEFRNFELSSRRAEQVLRFFYQCEDCGAAYIPEKIRPLLVLSGLGNRKDSSSSQEERRVDVVLDYSDGLE